MPLYFDVKAAFLQLEISWSQWNPTALFALNRLEKRGEVRKYNRAPQGEGGEVRMEREESEPGATLQEGPQSSPAAKRLKHQVGKKPANRRSAGQPSAAR